MYAKIRNSFYFATLLSGYKSNKDNWGQLGEDFGYMSNPVLNANMGAGRISKQYGSPWNHVADTGWNYANPVPASSGLWAEWTYTPVTAGAGKIQLLTWGPDFNKCVGRSEADFDNNCVVNTADLLIMADCWHEGSSCDPNVDLYASSSIDFSDYSLFAGDWLKTSFPNGVIWDEISVTNTPPPGPSITDKLVLYLPYDKGAGVITHDLSGNGFHGKLFSQYAASGTWDIAKWTQPVINDNHWVGGKWGRSVAVDRFGRLIEACIAWKKGLNRFYTGESRD